MAVELKQYDVSHAVSACGFVNMGATCYFNAMLQSLLGNTEFNRIMLAERKNNTLTEAYASMLDNLREEKPDQNWGGKIWEAFSKEIEIQKRKTSIGKSSSRQEDSQEALTVFLECCQSKTIDRVFEHRYRPHSVCLKCHHEWYLPPDEGFAIEVHLQELKDILLNNFIKTHNVATDGDYLCPRCGLKGAGTKKLSRRLTMLPEIIIIQFKKYEDFKWTIPLPHSIEFDIKGADGASTKKKYQLVSQTEHSGGRDGGHYWARSLRKDGLVYSLNDTSTAVSRWETTPHTYMAWYHVL